MKISELRTKTESELMTELKDIRKNLREKSKEVLNQKEKNIRIPRGLRKDIARILGLLKEKEILKATNNE